MAEKDASLPVLLSMAMQLGAAVAVPTALLAVGGNALDARYGTGSRYLLIGLGLGFALSMALVWKIVRVAQGKLV